MALIELYYKYIKQRKWRFNETAPCTEFQIKNIKNDRPKRIKNRELDKIQRR